MSDHSLNPVTPSPGSVRAVSLLLGTLLGLILAGPSSAHFGGGNLPIAMPIDVDTVQLDGRFLRNGTLFEDDYLDGGVIHVQSEQGDQTFLGFSWDQGFGPLQLIVGRYTPLFSSVFESPTAPRANAQPFSSPIDLQEDQAWIPDVGAVWVDFSFLLNGHGFPSGSGELADFYMRDVTTGREIHIGTSQDGTNSFFVVPGTYDVYYVYRSGLLLPETPRARILQGVSISGDMPIVVDVPSVNRTFSYFLDGDPFSSEQYVFGEMSLEIPETGETLRLGRTNSPRFARLIPGTYRVRYRFREGSEELPINQFAVIDEALVIAPTGATTVDIHVTSHVVAPEFLIDGGPSDFGTYDYGRVYLESAEGDRFRVGDTRDAPPPIRIVAGTYDAYYEFREGAEFTPRNPDTRFAQSLVVDGDGPLPLDIQTALLTLEVELNGAAFPDDQYDAGQIKVVDRHTGAEIRVGSTTSSPYTVRLIRGQYDIVYEWREGGNEVPVNLRHVIAHDLPVAQSGPQTIDVVTRTISPGFALGGDAFPASATDYGEFFLRDPDGDEVALGVSNIAPADRIVIEGAYAVEYEWRDGEEVPLNLRERVKIVSVPEAGFAQGLMLSVLPLLAFRKRIGSS